MGPLLTLRRRDPTVAPQGEVIVQSRIFRDLSEIAERHR
jgi:hypothetical protein